jgi:hypothetical protein
MTKALGREDESGAAAHVTKQPRLFGTVRLLGVLRVTAGAAPVLALQADNVSQPLGEPARAARFLVIKSHHGSAELDAWLVAAEARIILSVRGPRDASISTAQRFKAPLNRAIALDPILRCHAGRLLCNGYIKRQRPHQASQLSRERRILIST